MKRTITLLFSFLTLCVLSAQSRFSFTENKGQWDDPFLYKADIPSGAMFIEKHGITYHFTDWSEWHHAHGSRKATDPEPILKGHVVRVNFIGSGESSKIIGSAPLSGYNNYYYGNDPSKWVTKLYPVGNVLMKDIWQGIDVQYYSAGGRLKYDFIIHPGVNDHQINLAYSGADKLELREGNLVVSTSLGEITEEKPFAYQNINGKKVEIDCAYKLDQTTVSFELGAPVDPALEIIIDPTLIFASYSGSFANNFGMSATYSSHGELYAGGTAFGPGYPTTTGAYQTVATAIGGSGMTDVVISKYASDGTSMLYSTYLGGGTGTTGTETVHSMIEDRNGNLCVYGATSSTNFPTTPGAYDNTFNGGTPVYFISNGSNFDIGTDIYVTKFNSSGTALIGSTYVGGSLNDGVNANVNPDIYDTLQHNYGDQFRGEIYVDSLNNVYIVSSSQSTDFPTVNAYQSTFGGRQDAVVFKLDTSLSNLLFSTYVGGSKQESGCGMKLDNKLGIYFTGGTSSADFPASAGSYQPAFNGGVADGFIAHLSPDGDSLYNATFIGTSLYDQSYFLERDAYGTIYIYGQTSNPGAFPVLNAIYSNANSGQFVMNLDSTLSTVNYSAKFGSDNGGIDISPSAFRIDICGNVYISGWGKSLVPSMVPISGMPITPDAIQPNSGTGNGGVNFYLAVFKTNFDGIFFGSYFGGSLSPEHVDGGTSRFSDDGFIYQSVCAGCWNNSDFPTTPGVVSNTNNAGSGACNNGVFKIQFPLPQVVAQITAPPRICKGRTVNFTSVSTGANYIHWDFGDGGTSSLQNPSHQYAGVGTYTVQLIVIDTSFVTCVSFDTAYATIQVIDGDTTYSLPDVVVCQGSQQQIGITPDSSHSYTWTPASSLSSSTVANPFAFPGSNTTYTLYDNDSVCTDTIHQQVLVDIPPNANFNYTSYVSCHGVSLTLHDLSTGADSTVFYLNGIPIGNDSITLSWSSSYVITLWAYHGDCADSVSQVFNSGNFGDLFHLKMPNVFTPFTTGGTNDLFCPIGLNGEYCYKMHVFNRWGTEIWESSIDEPCWDGLHKDTDNRAVDGVYYFVINFQGGDQASFFHLISHVE